MTVSIGSSLASERICLFVDLWQAQPCLGDPKLVSWITLWGTIKVYQLDFSLHFRSCCLLRVCCKFGPKLASHYKPVEKSLDCQNHIRQTKSSIKKRIIVCWSVRSMFRWTNIRPVKNGLKDTNHQIDFHQVSSKEHACNYFLCVFPTAIELI